MTLSTETALRKPGSTGAPGWIDISVTLRDGMEHWPGDPAVRIQRVSDVARGDSHTLSEIAMGSHTGTHIDAPLHFLRQGQGIDSMPLEATVGRGRVLEIRDPELIRPEELISERIRRGERILFKTRNSPFAWKSGKFTENFVSISPEAAEFLAERKVRTVGIDYLSVGGYQQNGSEIHRTLLGAGIWLIEGLDLSQVSTGTYDLICLPLKIMDGDGAPARAFLRKV